MPLLDHFHLPVSERRSWEGFHGMWAAALVEKLNRDILADEYFADMQVHIGSQVEVDIASLAESRGTQERSAGPAATLAQVWAPPATDLILPAVFPDDIEVQVFATVTGATLVGAIELVSPGNKDHPETRQAFAAKCVSYLTRGIGLIVVDIVSNRRTNLHNDVIGLLGRAEPFLLPARRRLMRWPIDRRGSRPGTRSSSGPGLCAWASRCRVALSSPQRRRSPCRS
jgi:hypothetical protein